MGVPWWLIGLRIQHIHSVAWVTAVAQVRPLAQELLYSVDAAKKKRGRKERNAKPLQ